MSVSVLTESLILAVGSDGSMTLWNSQTRNVERRETVSPRNSNDAAFSPDGAAMR